MDVRRTGVRPFSGGRQWAPLGAALALVTVLAVVVLLARGDSSTGLGDDPGAGSGAGSGTGSPAQAGWRSVSYRDVAVEVPEEWGYAFAPGPDWCADAGDRFPREPYVDVSSPYDVVLAIGCGRRMPTRYDVTHLEFADAGSQDEPVTQERPGWQRLTRQVGTVAVTVWFDPQHEDVAHRVVESARVVAVDANGCAASSPIQAGHFARPLEPFRIEEVTSVEEISVCQYDLEGGTGVPGLLGSRRITGPAARDLLAAVRAAPVGGGPDAPRQCIDDDFGSTALVLRLRSGDAVRDMYVYVESCLGNGFDDGTSLRELTAAACRPLWALPVRLISGHSQSFARCHE